MLRYFYTVVVYINVNLKLSDVDNYIEKQKKFCEEDFEMEF